MVADTVHGVAVGCHLEVAQELVVGGHFIGGIGRYAEGGFVEAIGECRQCVVGFTGHGNAGINGTNSRGEVEGNGSDHIGNHVHVGLGGRAVVGHIAADQHGGFELVCGHPAVLIASAGAAQVAVLDLHVVGVELDQLHIINLPVVSGSGGVVLEAELHLRLVASDRTGEHHLAGLRQRIVVGSDPRSSFQGGGPAKATVGADLDGVGRCGLAAPTQALLPLQHHAGGEG